MADNVGIITGTGATIATDQHTTSPEEHYQIVKPAYGTRDTNTFTVVDPTHGLPVALTDGKNTAEVVASGTANSTGNAQLIAPTTKTETFSTTTAQAIASVDAGNYSWVSVYIKAQGTNSSVTFQISDDNVNWVSCNLISASVSTGIPSTGFSTTGMYHGPLLGRYFRLNVTGISAGTTEGTISFGSIPKVMQSFGVTTLGGTSAITGTITTSSSSIVTGVLGGYGGALISVHGTYAGVSYAITVSDDSGTTFYPVTVYDITNNVMRSGTITPATNASAMYYVPLVATGSTEIKVLASAYTSGTANIRITAAGNPPTFPVVSSQLFDAAGNTLESTSKALNVAKAKETSTTSKITSVAGAVTSTSLLAENTARKAAYFFNDSTAILYLAFAGSASTTAYTVQIPAKSFFEMPPTPVYTGAIFGIWAAAEGNARITELT